MPALAMTDHGNVFGAYDFYKQATAAGVKPIIGIEAYLTPGTDRRDRTRVRWADGGENDVSGGGAYTHMTMLAADADGLHNLFRLASPVQPRGLLLQAAGRPRAAARVRARASSPPPAARPARCRPGCASATSRRRASRRPSSATSSAPDNFYLELMDHGLDIERRVREDLLRLGKRLDLHAGRHQRPALHLRRRTPTRTRCCCACSPARRWPTRSGSSSTRATSTSSRPSEMRALWDAEVPGACDATLEIAERIGDYSALFASRNLMPQFPVPEGETEESWLRKEVARGLRAAVPRRRAGGPPAAGRVRARRHLQDGLPGLLPGRRRPLRVRQARGHPGRAGPWLGGRRADRLRAGHHRARPDRRTACSSSGSSTPTASRCPTSTWTSTSAGAAT